MCSGITSASTASRAFAANMSNAFGLNLAGGIGITLVGLAFMALVAAINFRGVGESVKVNVVLTCVELTGLLIIIFIGLWAIGAGQGRRIACHPVQDGRRWQHILAGHRRNDARLLRHGRVRGLGQHGGGMQGPDTSFPEDAARRTVHHRADLRSGVDLGHHARPA